MSEEFINLEKEYKLLEEKFKGIKEYKKIYFQNVQKNKSKYCACCDKYVKMNSWSNHLKSKKHICIKIMQN